MLAITYPMKRKRIKVAKWGTPKKYLKKILKKTYNLKFYLRGSASGPSFGLDLGLFALGQPERLKRGKPF
jgi:hypothetical protein